MLIRTANQQMSVKRGGGYIRWIEGMMQQRWQARVNWTVLEGVVAAEIVHSNWRVSCPFCRGAIVIEPGLPYFCPDCCMQANGFKPMWVQMPDEKTRREIERILLKRPDPVRRNWFPHETIDQLKSENLEHGIGV